MIQHTMMGGRLHIYKRENSRFWQCATFVNGRNFRLSTKEEGISQAKDVAEEWYLELRGKYKRGDLKHGRTFAQAATQFSREFAIITEGQRNAQYVVGHDRRLKLHLLPFFGNMLLSEITPGLVQEYRIQRREKNVEQLSMRPSVAWACPPKPRSWNQDVAPATS